MVTSGDIREELAEKSLPYTKFSIQMSDNATLDPKDVIPLLETIFLYNGLDAVSTQELIDNSQLITGTTSFFALLSAYIPARQASKIYPAETLRYE